MRWGDKPLHAMRIGPSNHRVPLLLTLVLLAAGCLGPSTPRGSPAPSSAQAIVEDHTGYRFEVPVANGTGSLLGRVLDDAGFPLKGAHASLLTSDHSATSNGSGFFQMTEIPPGEHRLRIDRPDYRAAESSILITRDNVTQVKVTLLPLKDTGAGYRQHSHNYWDGRKEVLVKDSSFEWARPVSERPALEPVDKAEEWAAQAAPTTCTAANPTTKTRTLRASATTYSFDEPSQTVWPGTAWINVSATWTDADYLGTALAIAWRSANATNWTSGPLVPKGSKFTIHVDPAMWDSGHQKFTLWEFGLCTASDSETGFNTTGRTFIGRVHVRMTLALGHSLIADPPHPRFWTQDRLPLMAVWRNLSIPVSGTRYIGAEQFLVRPTGSNLVPPGAKNLSIRIAWFYTVPFTGVSANAIGPPMSLTYSPANVAPSTRMWGEEFKKMTLVDKGENWRRYDVQVLEGETDAFYQKRSNWVFMWSNEGKENERSWYTSCGCEIRIRVDGFVYRGAGDEPRD